VELILSAMDAGSAAATDRRSAIRTPYRVCAKLHLHAGGADSAPPTLYTRDVDGRGMGFVTAQRLPLSYGGYLELPGPDGRVLRVACTVVRCRQTAPGWYEGALHFHQRQTCFDPPADGF
jgi:hypothetical protein